MLISFEGREWALDFDDLTIKQAEVVEAASGMTIGQWMDVLGGDGFDQNHPQYLKFVKIIYWLMRDQNGDKVKIGDVDFKMGAFSRAFANAAAAEDEEQPAEQVELPDPTRPPADLTPSPVPSSPTTILAATGPPDG